MRDEACQLTLMTKKKAPKAISFPQRVTATIESHGDGSFWLNAHRTVETIDNDERVGVYELVEVRTKKTEHRLE